MTDGDRVEIAIREAPLDDERPLADLVADLTLFVGKLDEGLQLALQNLPDEEARAKAWADAQKAAVGSYFESAQKYTTAVIAGGYAAYFTALSLLSARFTDSELSAATLLITLSLTVFVLHEVYGVVVTGIGSIKGNIEKAAGLKLTNFIWGASMLLTLMLALPAMGLLFYVCIKNLL